MLIYHASCDVECALWSYDEIGLTNHSAFFKCAYFLITD